MLEDMEASYPDSGSVIDSKEGGLEESEEVEDGAGEGGCDSHFSGTPPQTFRPGFRQLLGYCLWAVTHLTILSPDGLSMPIVLVGVITSFWVVHSPQSVPWSSVISAIICKVAPCFILVNTGLFVISFLVLSAKLIISPLPYPVSFVGSHMHLSYFLNL